MEVTRPGKRDPCDSGTFPRVEAELHLVKRIQIKKKKSKYLDFLAFYLLCLYVCQGQGWQEIMATSTFFCRKSKSFHSIQQQLCLYKHITHYMMDKSRQNLVCSVKVCFITHFKKIFAFQLDALIHSSHQALIELRLFIIFAMTAL